MKQDLSEFLARFDGKAVEWGRDDCTASPALWLHENGYNVSLPEYRTKEQAHAIIAAAGSLADLWTNYLSPAGVFERYGAPQLGDIAIIDTRLLGQVGVFCGAGGLCCWRKEGGFFWLAPRSFMKVWAVS